MAALMEALIALLTRCGSTRYRSALAQQSRPAGRLTWERLEQLLSGKAPTFPA
jgi:hypothetical protein